MKLGDITAADLKRAIEIYLDEVYGPAELAARMPKSLPASFADGQLAESLLPPRSSLFTHEKPRKLDPFDPLKPPTGREPQERLVDQYWLRLGNPRYPMMKLVLGEHLLVGEYFLYVDAHDWMFRAADGDDEERGALDELRDWNRRLKERVERRWNAANLPTLLDLVTHLSEGQVCAVERQPYRILAVDDDRIALETLKAFLDARGFDVDHAHDGVEALERADPRRHQLIILDVDMPRMNGLDACAALKADPARAAIPILLSSQRPLGDLPPAGANAFLIKPFHADLLIYMVRMLLGAR